MRVNLEAPQIGDEEGRATLFDEFPVPEAVQGAGNGFAGYPDVLANLFVGEGAEKADAAFGLPALATPLQQEAGEPGGGSPGKADGAQLIAVPAGIEAELAGHVLAGKRITQQEVEKALPLDRSYHAG
jgi:hypothetical protein